MKKTLILFVLLFLIIGRLNAVEPGQWKVYKSTHFLVYYINAPESFISKISDKSEDYYNRIADDLGFSRLDFWLWDKRAKIYIYDNARDYHEDTKEPLWSQGAALPYNKIIYTFIDAKDFLETTLPHEVSHIIFREFVGFNNPGIPIWLEEGVASYQEKAKFVNAKLILRNALADGSFIDLTRLSRPNPYSGAQRGEEIGLFYVESFSVVDFLIRNFGRDKFMAFCQDLRDRKKLDSALALNYNFSNLSELNQAWQRYIKNE
jgi:hypothetical protein